MSRVSSRTLRRIARRLHVLAAVIGAGGLVACGADRGAPARETAAGASVTASSPGSPADATTPDAPVAAPGDTAPTRDPVAIAALLETRSDGTYLPELLTTRDGWNYRWRDRSLDPLRIWIEPSALAGYRPAFARAVADAFGEWDALGLPFVFTIVQDSARAEVRITWIPRFDERMTGRTRWRHDRHGWIVGGDIELALQLPDGRAVTEDGVHAVARHEIGHLIGLDHVRDTTSVMSAQVYVTTLSEADRRTARLVYALPPGKLLP